MDNLRRLDSLVLNAAWRLRVLNDGHLNAQPGRYDQTGIDFMVP
jgi:hypothetical protein